jgi:predicted amidohydrolase
MKRKIKVAAAQLEIISGDYQGNLKRAEKMLEQAASQGVDIVGLPEFFSTGVPIQRNEEIPGPTLNFLCEKAKELKINIVGGTIREKRNDSTYNTSCFIDRGGKILGKYSKIHLWVPEQSYVTPGKHWAVVDSDVGKVGLIICWDLWYPEACRVLVLKGAEIIFCPAWVEDWGGEKGVPGDRGNLGRVRSGENQIFLVDIVSCGITEVREKGKMRLAGHSRIFGPGERMMAQVYAEAGYEPELVWAELNPDLIKRKREEFRIFEARSPEVYKDITSKKR